MKPKYKEEYSIWDIVNVWFYDKDYMLENRIKHTALITGKIKRDEKKFYSYFVCWEWSFASYLTIKSSL